MTVTEYPKTLHPEFGITDTADTMLKHQPISQQQWFIHDPGMWQPTSKRSIPRYHRAHATFCTATSSSALPTRTGRRPDHTKATHFYLAVDLGNSYP